MSAVDDFKELTTSLEQDKEHQNNIYTSIFILCSYDKNHPAYSTPRMTQHLSQSRALSRSRAAGITIETTVRDIPHNGLRLCLLFYGFTHQFTWFSLWTLYRLFIFLCLSFGYYGLIVIDSTLADSNDGDADDDRNIADYVIIAVETGLYPLFYLVLQWYLTQKKHFWILCSDQSTAFTRRSQIRISRAIAISLLFSIGFATLQKASWFQTTICNERAFRHCTIPSADQIVVATVFYLTFIMRLFELFLVAIIIVIICTFHHQQVISLINKFKNTNFVPDRGGPQLTQLSINDEHDPGSYGTADSAVSSPFDHSLLPSRKRSQPQSRRLAGGAQVVDSNGNKPNTYTLERLFVIYASIRVDILHTNSNISLLLGLFYVIIVVDIAVVVLGSLYRFIHINVFLDNASDLIVMALLGLYILHHAAKVTEEFNGISNKALRLFHYKASFIGWRIQDFMRLLQYFDKTRQGFRIHGIMINNQLCVIYLVLLSICALTVIGSVHYNKP